MNDLREEEDLNFYENRYEGEEDDFSDIVDKNYRYLEKYGLDYHKYMDILIAQKYKCKICDKIAKPYDKALGVDHCHKTGKVRGLLCVTCNLGIGAFRDSESLLQKAIDYIKASK